MAKRVLGVMPESSRSAGAPADIAGETKVVPTKDETYTGSHGRQIPDFFQDFCFNGFVSGFMRICKGY